MSEEERERRLVKKEEARLTIEAKEETSPVIVLTPEREVTPRKKFSDEINNIKEAGVRFAEKEGDKEREWVERMYDKALASGRPIPRIKGGDTRVEIVGEQTKIGIFGGTSASIKIKATKKAPEIEGEEKREKKEETEGGKNDIYR